VNTKGEIFLGLTTLSGWAHLLHGNQRRGEINWIVEISLYDPCAKIVNYREIARTFQSMYGPHILEASPSGREWIETSIYSRLQFRSAEIQKPSYGAERTRECHRSKPRNLAVP
jgi:hypothetical protein